MRIAEDRGGQIGHYLQTFAALRSSGEHVVIDGNCLSACTLVLGLIPRDRICATPRARFGFHAAWMPDDDGRPVTSPMGTQALWNIYPAIGAALDQPPRRPVAQDDLSARPRAQRHRGELRARPDATQARSAPRTRAASGALRARKRRQRPPLAPSPRRRGCRKPRTASPDNAVAAAIATPSAIAR